MTREDAEEIKGLKYNEIVALLTKAMQEQQAEIEALKVEMATLKSAYRFPEDENVEFFSASHRMS